MRSLFKIAVGIFSLLLCVSLNAQKTKVVEGRFCYIAPDDQSLIEAQAAAVRYAIITLLADTYGTYVSSTTSVRTEDGDSRYLQFSETEVKGEWLQTIGEPQFKQDYETGHLRIYVTIRGKAREVTRAKTVFQISILRNGTDKRFKSDFFYPGDYIYLSFTSPVQGYLAVFLSDGDIAQCMLPYMDQKEGSQFIRARREYVLFDPDFTYEGIDNGVIRRYLMQTESAIEVDHLYLVFSPNQFNKPLGRDGKDFLHPVYLSENDFQQWLFRIRMQDPDLEVVVKDITIKKAESHE